MTFLQLPQDWRRQPLSDSVLAADVVDLYCTQGDRRRGSLLLVIGDEQDRFKGAIAVDLSELSDEQSPTNLAAALRTVVRPLHVYPEGSLVLALARRGPAEVTDRDAEWIEAGVQACRVVGVRLLGFYLVSPDGTRRAELPVPAPSAA